ncbi:MAG: hypothetical protein OXC09_10105 [Truepera sp.]|nr:hypothetical protein [Truepera sp.]
MHTPKRRSTLPIIVSLTLALLVGLATAQPYQEAPMLAEMVAAGELPRSRNACPQAP